MEIRALIRSCVILNMVVVFVRVLCQYPILAVYRYGERWKDSVVLEKRRLELLGWFVFVLLCFIKLYFDKMFVAVKFLLESLQMISELMIRWFYELIIIRFKVCYQRSGRY